MVRNLSHVMAVEWIEWKRHFLKANHSSLRHLFGDAAELSAGRSFCYIQGDVVTVPTCDVLSLGFSCKNVSSLRGHDEENYDHAVLEGSGTSGSTCQYALAYIERHRPAVVLIENVAGLFKGYF